MAEVRDKAAVDLEWSQLLDALAGHCAGEVAAARLRAMDPATTRVEALERNRRSQAALDALALGVPVVGHAVNDCSALMALVERAGVASAEQLRDAAKVLTAASALRAYARAR
jgi:dsDNA-specific endonuclease/ATPase MutS2